MTVFINSSQVKRERRVDGWWMGVGLTAASLCRHACQQSLGTGRQLDFINDPAPSDRARAAQPHCRTVEWSLLELHRDKSSSLTNRLVKLLKIGPHFENFTSSRFAEEARTEELKRMVTGHQREDLGRQLYETIMCRKPYTANINSKQILKYKLMRSLLEPFTNECCFVCY